MLSYKLDFSSYVIRDGLANPVTYCENHHCKENCYTIQVPTLCAFIWRFVS